MTKGDDAFLKCVEFGNIDQVSAIIKKNPALAKNQLCGPVHGFFVQTTALIVAATYGRLEVAKLLIERGANVNAADYNGNTALQCAVCSNFSDVVTLLIDNGANIDVKDKLGRTALFKAAHYGYNSMASVLIGKCADVNEKDKSGKTPLLVAVKNNHVDMANLLIEKGAELNAEYLKYATQEQSRIIAGFAEHKVKFTPDSSMIELLQKAIADDKANDNNKEASKKASSTNNSNTSETVVKSATFFTSMSDKEDSKIKKIVNSFIENNLGESTVRKS